MLVEAGMDKVFTNLVNCVTSTSYNVLWNGLQTEYFFPHEGLRQGDPISPYLFVLCLDRLSHIITDAVSSGD